MAIHMGKGEMKWLFTYDAYKKTVTTVKKLKYWGLVGGGIYAQLKYNGKNMTIKVKIEKEKWNEQAWYNAWKSVVLE